MNWFTSDTHFGHFNIIEYAKRPYKTVQFMDEVLINNWNEKVQPQDTVYFLGDFCFKRCAEAPEGSPFEYYRSKLNGSIVFIQGNHDHSNGFKPILQNGVIEYGGERIFLVHKPEHYNPKYAINLVGHVHDEWKFQKYDTTILLNVGVDQWGFKPINIHTIMKAVARIRKGYAL